MTIALFYTEKNSEIARSLGAIMEKHEFPVHYYNTSKNINSDKNTPMHIVLPSDISHVLFIYSTDEASQRYYYFYSGFCLGKGLRFLLLDTENIKEKNDPFIHLGTMLTADTFEEFIVSEKIRFGQEEKIRHAKERLLEQGISCFPESFITVILAGDEASARMFLEAGFSPSLRDVRGVSVLSLAVRSQYPEMVRLLLKAGANVNDMASDRGYSPLMDAAQKGDEVMCRLLLESGANVNLASKDGQTALILCTGRGDERISTLLFEHGADPQVKDALGMSAQRYAALFKNEKLMELFNTPHP